MTTRMRQFSIRAKSTQTLTPVYWVHSEQKWIHSTLALAVGA